MTTAEKNKQVVIKYLTELIGNKNLVGARQYVSKEYIQHDPQLGIYNLTFKTPMLVASTGAIGNNFEYTRVCADENFVAIHFTIVGSNDEPLSVVDIFRLGNGMIAEHWNLTQDISESLSYDNLTTITDLQLIKTTIAMKQKMLLNIALWIVQTFLSLIFVIIGLFKLFSPISKLATELPWTGDVPPMAVKAAAVLEITGGIGIVLPSLLRRKPQLALIAAKAIMLLMITAAIFHISRNENATIKFNFIIILLTIFVAWGRSKKVPIGEKV